MSAPLEDWSPYEPLGVVARSGPPSARPSPERHSVWWRRMLPLLLSDKPAFFGSLGAALLSLIAAILIPRVTMNAIDDALIARTSSLAPYVWILLGLAVFRAILTYAYRTSLYGIAYRLEYDLRVTVFEHLTRMSFSFYDRVQSGQLISRANSDIRSVQMFLTFAPLVALNLVSFAVALVFMFTIHVGLTLVALATIPFVYIAGVKMRNQTFPLSWIVQSRMADVATIVDENVNGVRVVRSFAAEQAQVDELANAAQRVRWASVKTSMTRARYAPLMENLPRLGLAAVLLYGGWLAIDGVITVGAIVAFNSYVVMLQAPFRILGMITMLGQRAAASAERIYEILDEPADIVDRPGAIDLVAPKGDVELRDVTFAYHRPARRPTSRSSRTSTFTCGRARPSRSSGARAAGSRRSPDSSPASTTWTAARCSSTGTTSATSRCTAFERTSQSCSTSPSSSQCRSATTSPTPVPTHHSTT